MSSGKDNDGGSFIPASQRPDGTWRKPRRVRDGYVPQEEVPLYESKGRQFAAKVSSNIPVGLTPEIVAEAKAKREAREKNNRCAVPGLILANDPKKKKKKSDGSDDLVNSFGKTSISSAPKKPAGPTDPAKRLKNLKKKMREIEVLEIKLKNNELENPEKDQLEKVNNKEQVMKEIEKLEALLEQ